jgi:hypothetical protein
VSPTSIVAIMKKWWWLVEWFCYFKTFRLFNTQIDEYFC